MGHLGSRVIAKAGMKGSSNDRPTLGLQRTETAKCAVPPLSPRALAGVTLGRVNRLMVSSLL
jgi:hypothetical protein